MLMDEADGGGRNTNAVAALFKNEFLSVHSHDITFTFM